MSKLTKGIKLRISREAVAQLPKIKNRIGHVYHADKYKIVVEFKGINSEEHFRESFSVADLIENKAKIEVLKDGKWNAINESYFKAV